MTWDTVDAAFGVLLLAFAAGAIACVPTITRSYFRPPRMSREWTDRARRRQLDERDYREAA